MGNINYNLLMELEDTAVGFLNQAPSYIFEELGLVNRGTLNRRFLKDLDGKNPDEDIEIWTGTINGIVGCIYYGMYSYYNHDLGIDEFHGGIWRDEYTPMWSTRKKWDGDEYYLSMQEICEIVAALDTSKPVDKSVVDKLLNRYGYKDRKYHKGKSIYQSQYCSSTLSRLEQVVLEYKQGQLVRMRIGDKLYKATEHGFKFFEAEMNRMGSAAFESILG